jgi:hypothetical protein
VERNNSGEDSQEVRRKERLKDGYPVAVVVIVNERSLGVSFLKI